MFLQFFDLLYNLGVGRLQGLGLAEEVFSRAELASRRHDRAQLQESHGLIILIG